MTVINQLPWSEAIEQVITDNGDVASLDKMYTDILKYRDVSNNRRWKATLRGILYRDMRQRGRIVRVGLGVYGFKEKAAQQGIFQKIEARKSVKVSSRHSTTEGMLIELGNFYGYDTFTADSSAEFDGKPLGSIASLGDLPTFTGFADLLEQVKRIDVLWFNKRTKRAFPKVAYEVENTPEFRRALLKLYQLRDFKTDFFLIAEGKKRALFESRLNNDPFYEIKARFAFRSFEDVTYLYAAAAEHFLLRERFFVSE
ncbi:MAG: hypothetical protein ACE5JU_18465 [Candidatus Binatia bacterium]